MLLKNSRKEVQRIVNFIRKTTFQLKRSGVIIFWAIEKRLSEREFKKYDIHPSEMKGIREAIANPKIRERLQYKLEE